MNQQNVEQQMKEWNEISKMKKEMAENEYKMKEEMAAKKRKMNDEIVEKENKMMGEIKKGMMKNIEEIALLKKENLALKMKMSKTEALLKAGNLSINWPAGLPSELVNELFGSLPLKNAFGLLVKMPNGLLAGNVQKMINDIKMAMKENKLNVADCGSNLAITEGGLVAKHSGPTESNSVRAILPIPTFTLNLNAINKPTIVFFFEMEILAINGVSVGIGFCDQQFPLQGKGIGQEYNSIGIYSKNGIWIDGSWTKIGNDSEEFIKGDFVGLGIIHRSNSKMECFTTWNGQLLGKTELPSKFITMQLFPAVNLFYPGDSIRANFMKESWQFKEFGCVLE